MSTSGGYHEYIGGCSVHRRDIMSTSGMFSTSGCSVHRGDTMSTSEGYHDSCNVRGYHKYIGRDMMIQIHVGEQIDKSL